MTSARVSGRTGRPDSKLSSSSAARAAQSSIPTVAGPSDTAGGRAPIQPPAEGMASRPAASQARCSATARPAQSRADQPGSSGKAAWARPSSRANETGSEAGHCTVRRRPRPHGSSVGSTRSDPVRMAGTRPAASRAAAASTAAGSPGSPAWGSSRSSTNRGPSGDDQSSSGNASARQSAIGTPPPFAAPSRATSVAPASRAASSTSRAMAPDRLVNVRKSSPKSSRGDRCSSRWTSSAWRRPSSSASMTRSARSSGARRPSWRSPRASQSQIRAASTTSPRAGRVTFAGVAQAYSPHRHRYWSSSQAASTRRSPAGGLGRSREPRRRRHSGVPVQAGPLEQPRLVSRRIRADERLAPLVEPVDRIGAGERAGEAALVIGEEVRNQLAQGRKRAAQRLEPAAHPPGLAGVGGDRDQVDVRHAVHGLPAGQASGQVHARLGAPRRHDHGHPARHRAVQARPQRFERRARRPQHEAPQRERRLFEDHRRSGPP